MRRWMPFGIAVAFIALAWAADRWLYAAWVEAGSLPERTGFYLLTSLVVRAGFAVLAVGLGWLVLRGPRDRLVGVAMLCLGLYFSVVLTLNVFALDGLAQPIQLPLFLDSHDGYALRWAGTLLTLLGLILVVWPDRATLPDGNAAEPLQAWWPLVASLAVIGLSYPGAAITRDAGIAMASGDFVGPLLAETGVRFATLGALIGIGWLLLRGPRSALVGGLIAAAGLYVAVVLPLALVWYWTGTPGDPREPIGLPFAVDPADRAAVGFNALTATIIATLGIASVIWPTAAAALDASVADQDRADGAEVGPA